MYKNGTNKAIPPPSVSPIDKPNCGIFSTFTLGKIVTLPSNAHSTIAEVMDNRINAIARNPTKNTESENIQLSANANAMIGCNITRVNLSIALRNLFIIFNLG
tara:strand:- start:442 stop:750 length:309 start_codon:yes stop_codon:yes gene_type:complete